jgi:hypothetical protein
MTRHELPLRSVMNYDPKDEVIEGLWQKICGLEKLATKKALELFRQRYPDREPFGESASPDNKRALRRLEFDQLMAAAEEINALWAQISLRAGWTVFRRGIDFKMGQKYQIELDGRFRSVAIKRLSFGFVTVAMSSLETKRVCLEDLIEQSRLSMEYTPMANTVPQDPQQQRALF